MDQRFPDHVPVFIRTKCNRRLSRKFRYSVAVMQIENNARRCQLTLTAEFKGIFTGGFIILGPCDILQLEDDFGSIARAGKQQPGSRFILAGSAPVLEKKRDL
ncbi:hypothetical protein D3C81_2005050 [compost metagenome]